MKQRVYSFFDVFIYIIFCLLMIIMATWITIIISKNYSLFKIIAINVCFMIIIVTLFFFCRFYDISDDNIYFYYNRVTSHWTKRYDNVDMNWNQKTFINEIQSVEIVKLSKEEKNTKIFYKHLFNKYLKISCRYKEPKYVYIGNYSKNQIKNLISILEDLIVKNANNLNNYNS